MSKMLIAQSGGPSAVINATVAGLVRANQLNPVYDTVLGGLHGIEGILDEKFTDLTHMSESENFILRQTPAAALGSCRYKLMRENKEDFERVFEVMEKHDIETLFYIGGNDSMDTVAALTEYAEANNIEGRRFIGCPKTVDNDLMVMDHSPGYPSAAKFIATTAFQTWQDYNVYTREEVFVLETMGRDAGWMAAAANLSGIVDLTVLPEVPFDKEKFLAAVKEKMAENQNGKCYIVVSEGARFADGTYIAAAENADDTFGHAILGGSGEAISNMILNSGTAERVKVQNLSTAQRSHSTEASKTDVTEAFNLGMSAHMRSMDKSFTGKTVCLVRKDSEEYDVEYIATDSSNIANHVKNFPKEWILDNYQGVTEEALDYMRPLIAGAPDLIFDEAGLPKHVKPYFLD